MPTYGRLSGLVYICHQGDPGISQKHRLHQFQIASPRERRVITEQSYYQENAGDKKHGCATEKRGLCNRRGYKGAHGLSLRPLIG